MNKYDSFEIFMVEVVNKANSISNLNDLFDVKYESLIKYLTQIIKLGWWAFVALCVLLAMGPIAFGLSVGSFLLTSPRTNHRWSIGNCCCYNYSPDI